MKSSLHSLIPFLPLFSPLPTSETPSILLTSNVNYLSCDSSQSQSYFTTGGLPSISSSWHQVPWDSLPEISEPLRSLPLCNILSDGGWVCRLQLLLALASAAILGSDSRGTHDHILLYQFGGSPNMEDQVPPGTGWPSFTPRHWVPFSSPPTTRRAMVEVFEAAFTRGSSQRYFTIGGLLPISSSWRQAPWDPWPEISFSNWILAIITLM
jgi:hypothetical protein